MQPRTVALLVSVPVAAFVVPVSYNVYTALREESRIAAEIAREARAAQQAEADAQREEGLVSRFEQDIQQRHADVEAVEAEISVVQRRLEELQQTREARVKEEVEAAGALHEVQIRLARIVADARRHRAAATAAEAALGEARQHVAEARKAIANPLQHPLVKGFRSRS